uniref:Uncharacterized protein n=1 Tax=Anguilla anguilla TaxID=7936 RepID=A0A0E9XUI0_ANGAN
MRISTFVFEKRCGLQFSSPCGSKSEYYRDPDPLWDGSR